MERVTIEDCHFEIQEIHGTYLERGYNDPGIITRRSSFVNNSSITDNARSVLIDVPGQIKDPSGPIISNLSRSIEDSCFEMNENMGLTLEISTNVDDKGILDNNYQAKNTFREGKKSAMAYQHQMKHFLIHLHLIKLVLVKDSRQEDVR